ncbi:50S ribosomal protein L5 [Candidatus Uhrbacteria bacterium RIFCSPLOWO2_01_FULL_47_24]|uniref:Large ribosomal subunit protein uL5 n=1 Tax=Candidatus Uhrbacteria bacterium RIFCSPLOWO2_01_FULL_47_24 TaxID=1802401 RepID=A0A1F7UTR0_9BACT|nr:MAG: 50S ribosomal protein L5 [Candidatus Uhrbacteria bacterium RIFCSPHIGHO2_01_FULL_47_11]OGL68968.1 MAG: 50S ribosomal protein L5 [Candidatus Uhrbacteria bacterium RIFCSPHIGHO2_02_FULL_46_47]OGL74915.1 MAG: 50S ribosomal protein L5 [Candidatus Uhrbacteria bacterium RIFCSPHIGHO2_12_FULL_47_11]OGL81655.1 MAG: 50S ribosomal protein L5 [Candidatus Uhrbacteria bacterium RIFCSPLOWO2_01_FULL_47_24]OGL85092.1 MAG: 50S ribosomal protein L5 [Candidatus Uhrbacteria bacterium RIFCSPLOWO2_02_FULL_46_25
MTLKEHYEKHVIPAMKEQFGYKNNLAVPRIVKAMLNVGISASQKDPKVKETIKDTIRTISGQEPVERSAKKSISSFKIRKGQIVGMLVTLRGKRMYDFLDKLLHLTFPRMRDFRGLRKTMVDAHGNLTIGFREAVAFPEIKAGDLERQHGLEVTVVVGGAKGREEGVALLKLMGFPFTEK